MKRILVIALLAGVLISTIGVSMAVGEGNPTITRAIFASDEYWYWLYSAVGIVTLNLETGEWTMHTSGPLPYSDFDYYYFNLSFAPPKAGPHGRYLDCSCLGLYSVLIPVDGRINASGILPSDMLVDIRLILDDGGIFFLGANEQ